MNNQQIIAAFREYATPIKERMAREEHSEWRNYSRWELTGAFCMAVRTVHGSCEEVERALAELKAVLEWAREERLVAA